MALRQLLDSAFNRVGVLLYTLQQQANSNSNNISSLTTQLLNTLTKRNGSTTAFQLQDTDNTVAGGNARGVGAVDLQMERTAATRVASGDYSFTAGQRNAATANSSTAIGTSNNAMATNSVAIGNGNSSSSSNAVAMGNVNVASGSSAVAVGSNNTASGTAAVSAGINNTASGYASTAFGAFGTTNGISRVFVHGFHQTLTGRSQRGGYGQYADTADATTTRLKADSGLAGIGNQCTLRNNSCFTIIGTLTAYSSTGEAKSWQYTATVKRGANAASTVTIGSAANMLYQTSGAATWTMAIFADTTSGALGIDVTGAASTSIKWTNYIETVEVG